MNIFQNYKESSLRLSGLHEALDDSTSDPTYYLEASLGHLASSHSNSDDDNESNKFNTSA